MTRKNWLRVEVDTAPAWWGKEEPKERARRLWKKTAPWSKSPGQCYREGESGPDEGPPEVADGVAR